MLTIALHLLGVLDLPNGLAYDWLSRLGPERPVSRTLLVEAPDLTEKIAPLYWASIADRLHELGAEQVVFTFNPAGDPDDRLPIALTEAHVVLARNARRSRRTGEDWILAEAPLPSGVAWGDEKENHINA